MAVRLSALSADGPLLPTIFFLTFTIAVFAKYITNSSVAVLDVSLLIVAADTSEAISVRIVSLTPASDLKVFTGLHSARL
jgi:hypothetical protein